MDLSPTIRAEVEELGGRLAGVGRGVNDRGGMLYLPLRFRQQGIENLPE